MSKKQKAIGTVGRRKQAIAHATLTSGSGTVRINGTLLAHYTPALSRERITEPLLIAGDISAINISVRVTGGGITGQADAARLAIGRALVEHNKKLEEPLLAYDRQLLVADVRYKETSKPGRHGKARAKRQKSYR